MNKYCLENNDVNYRNHNVSSIFLLCFSLLIFLSSCVSSKKVATGKSGTDLDASAKFLLEAAELKGAHIGISIYDPAEKKYLYNYQGDKYFTPASNTKLITCYAAMKYLGDSLVGIRYKMEADTLFLIPSGDPTLLHVNFNTQPVMDLLKNTKAHNISIAQSNWNDKALGNGWAWDDYNDDYSAERSAMPVYGNLIHFEGTADQWSFFPSIEGKIADTHSPDSSINFVQRDIAANNFKVSFNSPSTRKFDVPFFTDSGRTAVELLQQILQPKLSINNNAAARIDIKTYKSVHSQPTDSLLKIMMHRSDNFFAEQSLLMVSNELLGVMNDEKIIDTLLKTDYAAMPQQPQWADGSGLSRFNLFTPQDFVFVLDKMRNEFSWSRIRNILPTGGTGTLEGLYTKLSGRIFAKTGTLSNNVALSGYIITDKNKTLIFSILVGNHTASAKTVRNKIEQCLTSIIANN